MPPWCPDEAGGMPQAGIHQVPIKVHRHSGGGVPQHPLDHLRVRACGQPQRRRCVAQIVNAHIRHSGCHPGGPPADRPLPVRLPQRPAAWGSEQPGLRLLPRAPPVDDRHELTCDRLSPNLDTTSTRQGPAPAGRTDRTRVPAAGACPLSDCATAARTVASYRCRIAGTALGCGSMLADHMLVGSRLALAGRAPLIPCH